MQSPSQAIFGYVGGNAYNPMAYPEFARSQGSSNAKRIETKGWAKEKPVSSVIITVFSGSSYDGLFREVKQEPPEPSVAVSLFQVNMDDPPIK